MLQITVPSVEVWDELNNEFIMTKEQTLQLEHSLVSLSKWESKWKKPYLDRKPKTREESIDYVRCMTITQNVNPRTYDYLTVDNINKINEYIEAPMTATFFSNDKHHSGSREIVTAEVIYWMMIVNNIPFECQKWHLNKLMTLIKVCNIKNNPPKPRSRKELMSRNSKLNAARRRRLNSRG